MEETKELLRKLYSIDPKLASDLWMLYILDEDKNRNKDIIRVLADSKTNSNYLKQILLPPPPASLLPGRYAVGRVIYPLKEYADFGILEDEFKKHVLIAGMTGAGKTNLAHNILAELGKHNKRFLVFDWKKSYRDVKGIKVYTPGSPEFPFYFNPLIPPPGVNPKEWMGKLVDVIKHAYFAGHGVEFFLRKAIDEMYKRYKIYDGGTVYPVFGEIERLTAKEYTKGREMLWMASVKRILASLTFDGMLGPVVNVQENNGLEKIFEKDIVIEMDALSNSDKVFLTEALLLWIYEYSRLHKKQKGFRYCIFIEEAHHVLSAAKEKSYGEETIIESIIRMIREFGIGMVIIDQEPSKMSDSIKANTYTKIIFSLGNGKDVLDMAHCINLHEREFLDWLKVGFAVIKTKRFKEAVLVKIPQYPSVGIP